MTKTFNIDGRCFADKHYMADVSAKLAHIKKMIEHEDYFVMNRPPQYGKTTTLSTLAEMLEKTGEYLVFNINFGDLDTSVFQSEKLFSQSFVQLMSKGSQKIPAKLSKWLQEVNMDSIFNISYFIEDLIDKTTKKVVLFIDNADRNSNNQVFADFLSVLRSMYLARRTEKDAFHSVVLACVQDVKMPNVPLHPDGNVRHNAPWNIAANFNVDMNLNPNEIKTMLDDYMSEKGVKMDTPLIPEHLFDYTSGNPFLVSKLCKMLDESLLQTQEWTDKAIDTAVQQLLLERNTNFDRLIEALENNATFCEIVHQIVIHQGYVDYNPYDNQTRWGFDYGLFKRGWGVKIHNKIYEALMRQYLLSKTN